MTTVRWKVEAEGGVGERTYSFRVADGKAEKVAQERSFRVVGLGPNDAGNVPCEGRGSGRDRERGGESAGRRNTRWSRNWRCRWPTSGQSVSTGGGDGYGPVEGHRDRGGWQLSL